MGKKIILAVIISLFLVAGCLKPPAEEEPLPQPEVQEQKLCTEMWICRDSNTKAYRLPDCTFEQVTDCKAGCENGECLPFVEEPVPEEPEQQELEPQEKEEPAAEPIETAAEEETCTIGWKCMDEHRKAYQFSNCVFAKANLCEHGCKDGQCLPAPPEEKVVEEFSISEGIAKMPNIGWKSCDFSEEQIFEDGVTDQDVKIKLYSQVMGHIYYRAESPISEIWVIDRNILDASRPDCMERITDSNAYNNLRSGKTLCILTKEKNIAMLGGLWDGTPSEDTRLSWKYYY
ncbi:hypothetical protein KY358_02680 [Candidatus Woesearchaeota archaeon]|nr:hypothetical protein [Candidatus Woesearchaeota archaeon]